MKMKYCYPNCKFLSITEEEQVNNKINHMCTKYNKHVFHEGHHPNLVRLEECDELPLKLDKPKCRYMKESMSISMDEYNKLSWLGKVLSWF